MNHRDWLGISIVLMAITIILTFFVYVYEDEIRNQTNDVLNKLKKEELTLEEYEIKVKGIEKRYDFLCNVYIFSERIIASDILRQILR